MMIATNNYFKQIDSIDFSSLPEAFKKGHEFLVRATDNGNSWTSYQSSDAIKKTIDIYLAKLNEFVNANKEADRKQRKKEKQKQGDHEIMQQAMRKQGLIDEDDKRIKKIASKKKE